MEDKLSGRVGIVQSAVLDPQQTLAIGLKSRRVKLHMNRIQAAQRLSRATGDGYTEVYIEQIEGGYRPAALHEARALAETYQFRDVDEMLKWAGL